MKKLTVLSSGFLVVSPPENINGIKYYGPNTQPFPFGDTFFQNSSLAFDYTLAQESVHRSFFMDYENAINYYHVCKKGLIPCRMIFCESTAPGPMFQMPQNLVCNNFVFLGYDYTFPNTSFHSTIANEILFSQTEHAFKWRPHLNQFGLFQTYPKILEYIHDREKFCMQNIPGIDFEVGPFGITSVHSTESTESIAHST